MLAVPVRPIQREVKRMADRVTTAADLARMTPSQRQQNFEDSLDHDLSRVRPEFLDQVRHRLQQRIEHDATKSA